MVSCNQCDQICRFIGLWATFKSFWQQFICPNLSHYQGIFCKEIKIYHFSSEIIFGQVLQTFDDFFLVTLPAIHNRIHYSLFLKWDNSNLFFCLFSSFQHITIQIEIDKSVDGVMIQTQSGRNEGADESTELFIVSRVTNDPSSR